MTRFVRSAEVLESAIDARAFSAVTAEVGSLAGPQWTYARGRLSPEAIAAEVDHGTIFDLASLTKVLATTPIGLILVTTGRLDLDAPVASFLSAWSGRDRESVRVRDLFEHSSGLPPHRRYFETMAGRFAYEVAIAGEPLDYEPRSRSIYTDLGFILLGFILEDVAGAPLDTQFRDWQRMAGGRGPLSFSPPAEWRSLTATTGLDSWRGRVLQGEVHDENAAALGGVAAHAGLFGTAAAVGETARWWLARLSGVPDSRTGISSDAAISFTTRSKVQDSSRALGWDTMLPTSSCGTRLSSRAIGHTGFTGTSLWIDPTRDLYVVLLTNYVHGALDRDRIRQVRRAFHDAVMDDLGR